MSFISTNLYEETLEKYNKIISIYENMLDLFNLELEQKQASFPLRPINVLYNNKKVGYIEFVDIKITSNNKSKIFNSIADYFLNNNEEVVKINIKAPHFTVEGFNLLNNNQEVRCLLKNNTKAIIEFMPTFNNIKLYNGKFKTCEFGITNSRYQYKPDALSDDFHHISYGINLKHCYLYSSYKYHTDFANATIIPGNYLEEYIKYTYLQSSDTNSVRYIQNKKQVTDEYSEEVLKLVNAKDTEQDISRVKTIIENATNKEFYNKFISQIFDENLKEKYSCLKVQDNNYKYIRK